MPNFDNYLNSDTSGKLLILRLLFDEVNLLSSQLKSIINEISNIKALLRKDDDIGSANHD